MNQPVPDELISAYFDGEVTADERARIERLLKSSSEHQQLLDDTSKLSALLHSFPREAAPAKLAANVQKKVDAVVVSVPSPAPDKRRSLRREWTAFAAGMVATVASIFMYTALSPSQNGSSSFRAHKSSSVDNMEGRVALRDKSSIARGDNGKLKVAENERLDPRASYAPPAVGGVTVNKDLPAVALSEKVVSTESANGFSPVTPAPPAVPQDSPNVALDANGVTKKQFLSQLVGGNSDLAFVPQAKEEFLQSLKNGDVIVQHIADPDHTVTVVEMTVVDINKGAELIQILLQKRNVRQIENGGILANASKASSTKTRSVPADKKSIASDELNVVYVRAPGEDLADTLSESVKLHPEIYRDMAPRLPFGLQMSMVSNSIQAPTGEADSKVANPSVALKGLEAVKDQASVAAEASDVIDFFAKMNGMAVEKPLNHDVETKKALALKQRMIKGGIASKTFDLQPTPLCATEPSTTQADLDKENAKSDKANKQTGDLSRGYATFRVAVDNQNHPAEQQRPTGQAIASNLLFFQSNNQLAYFGAPGTNPGQKSIRSNPDQRDPRLMRMLIVLKPEKFANHP